MRVLNTAEVERAVSKLPGNGFGVYNGLMLRTAGDPYVKGSTYQVGDNDCLCLEIIVACDGIMHWTTWVTKMLKELLDKSDYSKAYHANCSPYGSRVSMDKKDVGWFGEGVISSIGIATGENLPTLMVIVHEGLSLADIKYQEEEGISWLDILIMSQLSYYGFTYNLTGIQLYAIYQQGHDFKRLCKILPDDTIHELATNTDSFRISGTCMLDINMNIVQFPEIQSMLEELFEVQRDIASFKSKCGVSRESIYRFSKFKDFCLANKVQWEQTDLTANLILITLVPTIGATFTEVCTQLAETMEYLDFEYSLTSFSGTPGGMTFNGIIGDSYFYGKLLIIVRDVTYIKFTLPSTEYSVHPTTLLAKLLENSSLDDKTIKVCGKLAKVFGVPTDSSIGLTSADIATLESNLEKILSSGSVARIENLSIRNKKMRDKYRKSADTMEGSLTNLLNWIKTVNTQSPKYNRDFINWCFDNAPDAILDAAYEILSSNLMKVYDKYKK